MVKKNNVTITDHALGCAIFAKIDDIDSTQKVIKSTKPLVKKLMTLAVIAKLEKQIA